MIKQDGTRVVKQSLTFLFFSFTSFGNRKQKTKKQNYKITKIVTKKQKQKKNSISKLFNPHILYTSYQYDIHYLLHSFVRISYLFILLVYFYKKLQHQHNHNTIQK